MGTDVKALGWGIVVSLTTVLLVQMVRHGPVSSEGAEMSALLGLVYDYQTLITGVLAVIAAYMTVNEMRRADQNSDDRQSKALRAAAQQHEASMRLAMRADRLRVQRALHPQFRELHGCLKDMQGVGEVVAEMRMNAIQSAQAGHPLRYSNDEFEVFVLSFYPVLLHIQEILHRQQFLEGSKLFDGALAYRLSMLCEKTEEAMGAGKVFYDYHHSDPDDRNGDDDRAYTRAIEQGGDSIVMRYPSFFTIWGAQVLSSMRHIAKLYDVHEEWSPE